MATQPASPPSSSLNIDTAIKEKADEEIDDNNPSEIQFSTPLTLHKTPLILIHDGGSTIVSYHFLGPLDRPVWGIANPRFKSGEAWAGGIPEMAAHYVSYIRRIVRPNQPFLLGGWSLGGMLSLEVAKQLADEGKGRLKVKGMVFMDTTFPHPKDKEGRRVESGSETKDGKKVSGFNIKFGQMTKESTKTLVLKSFENSVRMVRTWKLPEWDDPADIPYTVLLRATDHTPLAADMAEDSVSRVDVPRGQELLGWEDYEYDLIKEVHPIRGHHFNIFSMENVDDVTEKLKAVCDKLDARVPKRVTNNVVLSV